MTPPAGRDRVRQILNATFAVGQIVAPFVPFLFGVGRPLGEGEQSVAVNPTAPPAPAFAIWGVLFPAALAYAVYQAAPSRAANPHLRRVGWLTATGLALTTGWVLWSVLSGISPAGDVVFSAAILACYLAVLVRAANMGVGIGSRFVTVPFSLTAGWLTVALGVNAATLLVLPPAGLPPEVVAISVVALAAVAGAGVPRLVGGAVWYALPVAWGLGWIAAGNLSSGGSEVVAVSAAAAAMLVVGLALFARPGRPPSPEVA